MKVKCTTVVDALGVEVTSSPWMTLNAIYDVITLLADPSQGIKVRIISEQGPWRPIVVPLRAFQIANNDIPPNWVVKIIKGSALDFAPEQWMTPGFWEQFFDGDIGARQIYEMELALILNQTCDVSGHKSA